MKKILTAGICMATLFACADVEGPRSESAGLEIFTGSPVLKVNTFSGVSKTCGKDIIENFASSLSNERSVAFAALYANKSCGWQFYYSGHSRKGINEITKAVCESATGEACFKVAEIIPSNYEVTDRVGFTALQKTSMVDNYLTTKKYGAIALSESGASNMNWDHETLAEAKQEALKDCNNANTHYNDVKNLFPTKFPCRIVHSRTPDSMSAPVYIDGVKQ